MNADMGKTRYLRKISFSVEIYKSRKSMGEAAGKKAEEIIQQCLRRKKEVSIIAAAAPSQNEILSYLAKSKCIDWGRVIAFHMDEYIGLGEDAPQGFGNFLRKRLFDKVPFKEVHYLRPGTDPVNECARYTALLKKKSIDLCLCGIGENGHIAFNDPQVADFNDPLLVKVVSLDSKCRNQQVHDGCFSSLNDVPKQALTLTIPVIMGASSLVCTVPAVTKAVAVDSMLNGPVGTKCPASILRHHSDCYVFLDAESGKELL